MTARIAAALAVVLWALPAGAQTASGSIQGQVVDWKTGALVRFATVMLRGPYSESMMTPPNVPAPSSLVEVTADDQGRFVFGNVVPGNYAVNARREGYTPALYGATRTARALVPVKEGERVTGITIKMKPCGVIAGRVVNEKGNPVQNAELAALRYYYGAWVWRPPVGVDVPFKVYTNDLGEFRIANLPAGPYILRAAAPQPTARNKLARGQGYANIFYPHGFGPDDAEPVVVASGEVSQANITLRPGPAFRITGVIDSNGSDEPKCLGLSPKRYHAAVTQVIGRVTLLARNGQFQIDGVPPGSYTLSATTCRDLSPLAGMQPVEVAGDMDGLRIQLTAGQRLSGVVKTEGVNAAGVKLALRASERPLWGLLQADVARDGAFAFERVMPFHYMVDYAGLPPDAYVKSVKYGGKEVPQTGLEWEADASLEITLSSQGAAQLGGSVLDQAGAPAPYPMIMVIPADGGPAESAKDVMGDKDGNFVFPALRPGTYKALAWGYRYNPFGIEAADPMLPLLFDANARTVTLVADAPQSVRLTLNTLEDVSRARAGARMTPPKNP